APPLWPRHVRNAIVFRERFVEEGVIRVENLRDRTVALEEIEEEQDRFFVDRLAESRGERREQLLVLFLQRVEVADVNPLRAGLDRQRAEAFVLEHPSRLAGKGLRITQFSGGCASAQLIVGRGRPQEITEPGGKLPVVDRAGLRARRRFLDPE